MTAVFHKNAEFGTGSKRARWKVKCDAVSIDDKWPSFDWTNGEIRARTGFFSFFFFFETKTKVHQTKVGLDILSSSCKCVR